MPKLIHTHKDLLGALEIYFWKDRNVSIDVYITEHFGPGVFLLRTALWADVDSLAPVPGSDGAPCPPMSPGDTLNVHTVQRQTICKHRTLT